MSPADRLAPRPADPDSVETRFLDSLRAMQADSTARPTVEVPVEEVRAEVATLMGGARQAATWDIDVETYATHERVLYWMGYFTRPARWHFERYLERLGRYDSMIRARLAAAGLPQDMIHLAMIESGFNQNARSRAGAVGLWQFIPATGRRYGLTIDAWVDDRRDPYRSTDAAIRFLTELNGRFGSMYLAAAAYNGGPGRVERGLRRGDFGTMGGDQVFFAMADEGSRYLRRETRDYVPKLIAAALLAKEPERYGFTGLSRWQPLRYDSVTVNFAVGLDVVARLAGTATDVIDDMNARFHRGVTPPDRRVWVRVPPGTADSVGARLAVLPVRERVTMVTHVVARGETLSRISRQYGVSVADIMSANHLRTSRIYRGDRLVIPVSRSRTWQRSPRAASAPAAPRTSRGATSVRRIHVVRAGETPGQIAEQFHVPLSRLLAANGLGSRSLIRVGQRLRIPD